MLNVFVGVTILCVGINLFYQLCQRTKRLQDFISLKLRKVAFRIIDAKALSNHAIICNLNDNYFYGVKVIMILNMIDNVYLTMLNVRYVE